MIKGHVMIELHNHYSGSRERIEGDNLVTQAISRAIPPIFSANKQAETIMPLYNRMLGGLLLFDDEIAEDPANYFLPANSRIVAMADQTVNTQYNDMGSYNAAESYASENGQVTVWDFSTSQANGEIGAIARTWVENNGKISMLLRGCSEYISRIHATASLSGSRQQDIAPLIYDENSQMLYYIGLTDGYSRTQRKENGRWIYTHNCTIYREYVPINKFRASDTINMYRIPEEVTTFSFDSYIDNQTDSVRLLRNGYDGYAYYSEAEENSEGDGQFFYFRIKLSDLSFDKSEVTTVTAASCQLFKFQGCIAKGKAYLLNKNLTGVYIVDLSNPANVIFAQTPEERKIWNENEFKRTTIGKNGNLILTIRKNDNENMQYGATLYPDGRWFVREQENVGVPERVGYIDDNLVAWGARYGSYQYNGEGWFYAGYLGTIYNLSTPVVKTPNTSMKIVYTLTDVEE